MAMAQNYQPPIAGWVFLLNMIRNLWVAGTLILSHSHMMVADGCWLLNVTLLQAVVLYLLPTENDPAAPRHGMEAGLAPGFQVRPGSGPVTVAATRPGKLT